MTPKQRDIFAFQLAQSYLPGLNKPGVTQDLVDSYLHIPETRQRPEEMSGVFRQLLQSAQNANMKAAVVGGSIGGIEALGAVLDGFDPGYVLQNYRTWDEVLDRIEAQLKPRGDIRRTNRSIWPQFCQSILSGAEFLSQFDSADQFYEWADIFDIDDRTRPALPMLLQQEVAGMGFALSCDFLKELGYKNFPKPDVHIKDIFLALDLCPQTPTDYQLFKAVVRVANHSDATPFAVDKAFWLVGSGYFHDHPDIGNKGGTGSSKKAFIAYSKDALMPENR
jgi:hypothetical protein